MFSLIMVDDPSVVRKVKRSNMQQMKDDFYFKNQANCAAAGYIIKYTVSFK